MGSITIYRTENLKDIPGLEECLTELGKLSDVEHRKRHVPAVVGELTGVATEILLSNPVQLTLTTIAIGQLFWKIVELAKAAGKSIRIGKPVAKAIISAKAVEDATRKFSYESIDVEKLVVYGPMETDPESGFAMELEKSWDEGTSPIGYFVGVVFPRPRDRVRTAWYLISAGGEICASWSTQTLSERMPDFLNPNKK